MDFQWPGNVRELENTIQRSVTLSAATTLDAVDIHLDSRTQHPASGNHFTTVLREVMTLDQWEQETIREALRLANGNKSQAARAAGTLAKRVEVQAFTKWALPTLPIANEKTKC